MKLHASINHVAQIGPYEYEAQTKIMDLTPETTVAEIIEWYKRTIRYPENKGPPIHLQISGEPTPTGGTEDA